MDHRPVYDELNTPQQMRADAEAAVIALQRAHPQQFALQQAVAAAQQPAPSIRFDDYPPEIHKRSIDVSLAAKRVADALHLHLD